jgi:glutamate 5-kinase
MMAFLMDTPNNATAALAPLSHCRRIVLKLGTNILRSDKGSVNAERMNAVGRAVADLRKSGREVVIVSSGAIGLGMGRLNLGRRPTRLTELQACAAIGQTILMQTWEKAFEAFGITVAQVLLTREDVRARKRHLAVKDTLDHLLFLGVVPVINENDTVSTDEIKFGDNDILSALVASLVKADLLAILSTAPGLVDREGTGEIVPLVPEITPEIRAMAGGSETATSVGGMVTKLDAAHLAASSGCTTFIGSGKDPAILPEILLGKAAGTYFPAKDNAIHSKKRWIAFFQSPKGTIYVDSGARDAIAGGGSSLLPKGVTGVEGEFEAGEVVNIKSAGETFARGVASFSSAELLRAIGRDSKEIRRIYPERHHFEAVHRDALVLLQ